MTEPIYQKHVFICVNVREGKISCKGMELVEEMKRILNEKGIGKEIRVSKSGCLGQCALGPMIVVYPEGIWYSKVSIKDIEVIVNEHLIGGHPVERLRIR